MNERPPGDIRIDTSGGASLGRDVNFRYGGAFVGRDNVYTLVEAPKGRGCHVTVGAFSISIVFSLLIAALLSVFFTDYSPMGNVVVTEVIIGQYPKPIDWPPGSLVLLGTDSAQTPTPTKDSLASALRTPSVQLETVWTAVAGPPGPTFLPVAIYTPEVSFIQSASYTLTGRGVPGNIVSILVGDIRVADTTVDVDGNWSLALLFPGTGRYAIRAIQMSVDGLGIGVADMTIFFIIPTPTPPLTQTETPIPTIIETPPP